MPPPFLIVQIVFQGNCKKVKYRYDIMYRTPTFYMENTERGGAFFRGA